MSVNTMSFEQIATVLNSIVHQATGQNEITPTNTAEFVSVANTALSLGDDVVMNAISNVLSRTIFAIFTLYCIITFDYTTIYSG